MANTIRTYTSDGAVTIYAVDFTLGYIDKSYVYVYLEGDSYTEQLDYAWVSNSQIELTTAPANGVKLIVRRVVPRSFAVNDYENGSILRERELDNSFAQGLMIQEEIVDGFINVDDIITIRNDLNMLGNRIINLPDAIDEQEPATYKQLTAVRNLIGGQRVFSTVASMVANLEVAIAEHIVTYAYNSQVRSAWDVVNTGNGDMSDGTLLLDNGFYAKLQIEPVMSLRAFGTYGNGINDDTLAVRNTCAVCPYVVGNPSDTYLLTGQIPISPSTMFDGMECNFNWNGVAGAITFEGRDWGIFSAMGTLDATIDTHVLAADIEEFEETSYPVGNSTNFTGRDNTYMLIFAGSSSSAPELPSFGMMIKYIGVTGTNLVAIDYRSGWTIPLGQSITYIETTPVKNITIKNFTIEDVSPDSADTSDYASVISLAFAYDCHVSGIKGVGFRNPVLMAQYCTDCTSSVGKVERPQATGGGQGYHTQWSYSLRCDSWKLTGYEARHICDHTKSAYCNVRDCGDSNTKDGAYTNHGAYEHDISYYNCVGWHSVANSGAQFGQSAKRIHIENGKGNALTAARNVIDVTVINSRFSRVLVNNQGFQCDGLTVDDDDIAGSGFSLLSTTDVLGRNTKSLRPNVISNSSLVFNSNQVLTDFSFTGRTLYINNTDLRKINSSIINSGAVKMTGGSIEGTTAAISLLADASLYLYGVDTNSFGVRHNLGCDETTLHINGGKHTDIVTTGLYSNRMTSGKATVTMFNVEVDGDSGFIIDMPNVAGTNEVFMDFSHNTFSNGSINIANIYSGAGKLFYTHNLEVNLTRTIDVTNGRRLIENNITV